MISITVHNADIVDLFVLVVDNNQPGAPTVFNQRVNQDASSAPFSVQEDGNGKCFITWTATDVSDPGHTRTAMEKDKSAGDQVDVAAS